MSIPPATTEPRARDVRVTDSQILVTLVDGTSISAPLAWFPRLRQASPEQRSNWELVGDGEWIRWPDVDEDLSVAGLLLGIRPRAEGRSGDRSSEVEVLGGGPGLSRSALVDRLRRYFAGADVERAVLFGSYARGEADDVSDLDLLVVERSELPFPERGRRHAPVFRLGVGVDLLVYTPEELERLRREGSPLVARAEREGVVLYERPAS